MLNFHEFLHTMYKYVLNSVAKIPLLFAHYFEYYGNILRGAVFSWTLYNSFGKMIFFAVASGSSPWRKVGLPELATSLLPAAIYRLSCRCRPETTAGDSGVAADVQAAQRTAGPPGFPGPKP